MSLAKCLGVALVALSLGCAAEVSSLMEQVGTNQPTPVPLRNQVVVVFMRPSGDSADVQATVYDLQDDGDHFIGVVSDGTRVNYTTWAGRHLFMVIGENADFMEADMVEGKTYYVRVTPRAGKLKARFSLKPVRKAQIGTPEWTTWDDTSQLLLRCNMSECERWANNNVNSVVGKRQKYMQKWERKTVGKRRAAGLQPQDGYP